MNKFLTATSVLLLALSGYLGYRVFELTHSQAASVISPEVKKCLPLSYDYSNGDSEGVINYETAKALADNYNRDKKGIIAYKDGAFVPGEDSRSVWFSLDRLKNFIWHIEKQNCENNCGDSLGLRIYFGRYPNLVEQNGGLGEGLNLVPKEYSNRHTLFMVPTYKDKTSKLYYDFFPGGKTCRTPLKLSPTHSTGGDLNLVVHDISPYIFLFDMSGGAGNGDSQNHGGLIPPGNPTGTSF